MTATAACHPLFHAPDYVEPDLGVPIPRQVEWETDGEYLHRLTLWRREVRVSCAQDKRTRTGALGLCRKSFVYWCLAYAYTFVTVAVDDKGERKAQQGETTLPFALWPMQEACAREILRAYSKGEPIFIDKSREVGASWLVLAILLWLFLFKPQFQGMVMSRVEDDVDNRGALKTLFGKLDFILQRLPPWMAPRIERAHMRLKNLDNGSEILGTSTTKHAARGARYGLVLVDEAAAIEHFDELQHSLNDACPTPVYVTTPYGPGPCYDLRLVCPNVFVMGYWDHPKKGKGRKLIDDPKLGRFWWSPYFEHERKVKKRDDQDLAQNLLCDWAAAASQVMNSAQLNRQMATFAQPNKPEEVVPGIDRARLDIPAPSGELEHILISQDVAKVRFRADKDGPWRFWCRLSYDRDYRIYRPPQNRVYVIGADVSWGVGASNSTMFVIDGHTGEQVGEYESAELDPKDFARQMATAGYWWGGEAGAALLSWEATGPGNICGEVLKQLGYPLLYRPVDVGRVDEPLGNQLGWQANQKSLVDGFAMLRDAIARDEVQIRSPKALADLGKIVRDKTGRITHGRLIGDQTGAKATHADHATAVLVAVLAKDRVPELKKRRVHLAHGSLAWVDAQQAMIAEQEKPRGGWRA